MLKKGCSTILLAVVVLFAGNARADWFLSDQVKVLIVRAQEGDVDSQLRVAMAYDTGRGAPRDGVEAMKWYRKAADAGNVEAQNSVGSGLQAEKRYAEALPWYEKAAAQGYPLATNNLAYLYDEGLGIPQDRQRGRDLYLQAADLGWAESMWNLANMYGAGQLGQVDKVATCVWTKRAIKYARPEEVELRRRTSSTQRYFERWLTSDEATRCEEEVGQWKPKNS